MHQWSHKMLTRFPFSKIYFSIASPKFNLCNFQGIEVRTIEGIKNLKFEKRNQTVCKSLLTKQKYSSMGFLIWSFLNLFLFVALGKWLFEFPYIKQSSSSSFYIRLRESLQCNNKTAAEVWYISFELKRY